MGRKRKRPPQKGNLGAEINLSRTKKARSEVLTKRSGFTMQDEALEQALLSGDHAALIESYFGEKEYQELQDLVR